MQTVHIPSLERLCEAVYAKIEAARTPHTRICPLKFGRRLGASVFCKREDETGYATGGAKLRKYASLLPFLKRNAFDEVAIIGGAYANNVLAMAQFCNEISIKSHFFLRGEAPQELTGNYLLLRMFAKANEIVWIPRSEWSEVTCVAQDYAETRRLEGARVFVVTEGAATAPALPGMLTLFLDILQNEKENELNFSTILLDAGTGATAAALLLADSFLQTYKKFHILLTAGDENSFLNTLNQFHYYFQALLQISTPFPAGFKLYAPEKPFGRVAKEDFENVVKYARNEGILTDPIYTAKLFAFAEKTVNTEKLSGDALVVHSGGLTSIGGFQKEWNNLLQNENFLSI